MPKRDKQNSPPVIAVLSEEVKSKEQSLSLAKELEKYLIARIETVQMISLGRQADEIIASCLKDLGKNIICHTSYEKSHRQWKISAYTSSFKKHRLPPGKKEILFLQEQAIRSSDGILAFWSGSTISNPIHQGLELSKKLNKHIIQRIML